MSGFKTLIPNWREGGWGGVVQAKGEWPFPCLLLALVPFPPSPSVEICPWEALDPAFPPGLPYQGRGLTTLGSFHNSPAPDPLLFQCPERPFPSHLQLSNHCGCGCFPAWASPSAGPQLGPGKGLQRESDCPEPTPFPSMGEEWSRPWPWDDTLE